MSFFEIVVSQEFNYHIIKYYINIINCCVVKEFYRAGADQVGGKAGWPDNQTVIIPVSVCWVRSSSYRNLGYQV